MRRSFVFIGSKRLKESKEKYKNRTEANSRITCVRFFVRRRGLAARFDIFTKHQNK